MKRFMLVLGLLFFASYSFSATQINTALYEKMSLGELRREHKKEFNKSVELYKLKKYKASIPYADRAIYLGKLIIKVANLRKKALRLLKEARKAVKDAGKIMGK